MTSHKKVTSNILAVFSVQKFVWFVFIYAIKINFALIDLELRIFGNFTAKEVIGETPLETPEMRKKLEEELANMVKKLEATNLTELNEILEEQIEIKQKLGSLTGAMALAQNKIQLFMNFISKYIDEIKSQINKHQ